MRTTAGHVINFKKGMPVYVPPMIQNEAVAIGAECVDGPIDVLGEEPVVKTYTNEERTKLVFLAFEKIIEKNVRGTFTAQGVPTVDAVKAITGFSLLTPERMALWRAYKEAKAA